MKNHEQTEDIKVRTAYGMLSSVVGMICNVFLFAVKLTIGILMNSLAVMADAFNNLSDAASSVISFMSVKRYYFVKYFRTLEYDLNINIFYFHNPFCSNKNQCRC